MTTSVKVRGQCPLGHVTDATANNGRTTWEGPCGHPGCDYQIKARRIRTGSIPSPAAGPVADADDPNRLIRIPAYERTDHGAATGVTIAEPATAEADAALAPDHGADPGTEPEGGPRDPISGEDTASGGVLGRLGLRKRTPGVAATARSGPHQRGSADYRHPLIG